MTRAEEAPETHLSKTLSLVQRLAGLDSSMQVGEILTFLHIALNQDEDSPISTGDLIRTYGMSNASASRSAYYWADGLADGKRGGFRLVDISLDPRDRRHLKPERPFGGT
jgi:hypothetical protein